MDYSLRIARPVSDLRRTTEMYRQGLGLSILGHFEDHQGFDGVMLGRRGLAYHFEFTRHLDHPVSPSPTPEDLVVFYVPDVDDWQKRCQTMIKAGFQRVSSFNPYWDTRGRTFVDNDGYRVVLENDVWESDDSGGGVF